MYRVKVPAMLKRYCKKGVFKNASKAVFLPKIAFRKTLLSGWVEIFVACYWCRWKVQDMTVRVVFFILKLVRKFLSDDELNTAWNREKIAMSQGFARYWVTLLSPSSCLPWRARTSSTFTSTARGSAKTYDYKRPLFAQKSENTLAIHHTNLFWFNTVIWIILHVLGNNAHWNEEQHLVKCFTVLRDLYSFTRPFQ